MMSEGKSNHNGVGGSGEGSSGGLQAVPSTTKKVIQNLKEIVNVPEQEIYAVLKECDMEPNVAVERLLAQDTFHVVKRKRERRKEIKVTQDLKSRVNSNGHNRGGRAVNVWQRGSSHLSYNERHKLSNKGEIGSICVPISSSTTPVIGTRTDLLLSSNDVSSKINGIQKSIEKNDTSSSTSAPSSLGHLSAWSEASDAQLSMAEIVRMGKPTKDPQPLTETFHPYEGSASSYQAKNSQVSSSESEQNEALDSKNKPGQSLLDDDGHGMEQPMDGNLTLSDVLAVSGDVIAVSSAAASVQRLNITQTEEKAEVVLPNNLQALVADCLHLSFGTYNAGSNSALPAAVPSNALKDDRKESTATSSGYLNSSNSAHKGSMHDNYSASLGDDHYDYLASQSQVQMQQLFSSAALGCDYNSSSVHEPNFSVADLASLHHRGADLRSRDLTVLYGDKTLDSDSIARDFLVSSLKSPRALQSSYHMLQSMSSKYNDTASPVSSSSFSIPEVMKPIGFTLPKQSPMHSQHLEMQPVDQLANPIGYPSSPRSNIYKMSLNLQHLYSDGSGYNFPLPDIKYSLQHIRNEVSMSRTSLFERDTSLSGNLRSLVQNPGSCVHELPLSSMNSSGYNNILPSQYRGGNNLNPLEQNDCFSMRSMSSVPDATYYQYMGRKQFHGEYQLPQLTSSYGVPRYSDVYPSHTGIPIEHPRQGGSQDHSKQSLRTW